MRKRRDTANNATTEGGNDETKPSEENGNNTEGKTLKVGMICIGDENDQGYTYNFYRAKDSVMEKMAAKGVTLDWNIITNIGEDDGCTDACVELAEAGCDVVICNSYGHEAVHAQGCSRLPQCAVHRLHEPELSVCRSRQLPQRLRQHL